jgi:hypothetical protein
MSGQVFLIISVFLITSGGILNRFAHSNSTGEYIKMSQHEHFWAVGASALTISTGAVLFLAAFAIMFIERNKLEEIR